MINAELQNSETVIARLNEVGVEMQDSIAKTIMMLTFKLQAKVQGDKLSGQVLNTRTNVLRASINAKTTAYKNSITGQVGTNVKYARIHEYGGIIKAQRAKYLRFQIGDRWIMKKQVTIPQRSFLRSALKDMTPEIKEALEAVLRSHKL